MQLIALAGRLHLDEIDLRVMQDNTQALSLYMELGFRVAGGSGYEM